MSGVWSVGVCVFTLCYLTVRVPAADTTSPGTVTTTTPAGLFYCYDCNSNNTFCPGDASLDPDKETAGRIVVTNCTRGQKCFTRTNLVDGTGRIYRGCTKLLNVPNPLPIDGCYDKNGDNICLCSDDRCNRFPLGPRTGVKISAHLQSAGGGYIKPPYVPRGNKAEITCNVCNSGKPDKLNVNCLADRTANWKTSWKENCTGRCITKTNFLYPDVEVFRECSDNIPSYPKPFPSDGCYSWFGDTICVCNYDLCNSGPIGRHANVELDAHLQVRGSPNGSERLSYLLTLLWLPGQILLHSGRL